MPLAVGVNVTLIVQLEFPAREAPQLLPCAKSPEAPMLLMVTALLLVFVTVTVWGELVVPTTWLANVRLVGATVTCDPQLLNLKFAIRVFQLNWPVVFMYSCVYQKVQSSTGSTVIAL